MNGLLFADAFDYPDGVITNEYATKHPKDPRSHLSPRWTATSGSLFARDGKAWSGLPDDAGNDEVDVDSKLRNNSAKLRVITKRADFLSVVVSFNLTNLQLVTTSETEERDFDGFHVFIRRQTEDLTYYVSVNRRDNTVVIKRKRDCYYPLNDPAAFNVPLGVPQRVRVESWTVAAGSVAFRLLIDDVLIQEAVDDSENAITVPGAVGIRGDNCEFLVDDFEVHEFVGP